MPLQTVLNSDCLVGMSTIEDGQFDCLITDPPYGIAEINQGTIEDCLKYWFDGQRYKSNRNYWHKEWDNFCPSPMVWKQARRALKEGAYGLVFSSSRTIDIMSMSLRLAGFEIKDTLMWVYSTGMPKGKMMDTYVRPIDPAIASFYEGVNTQLKPAFEPVIVIRNPSTLRLGQNAIKNGRVGLQVDRCRIGDEVRHNNSAGNKDRSNFRSKYSGRESGGRQAVGRYPSNLLLSGDVADQVEWSRFFYCDKPTKKEKGIDNDHPTVKPISLMRYLVKLTCPVGGAVLDPFAGSGSTGIACKLEGMRFLGFEQSKHFADIANHRIDQAGLDSFPDKPSKIRKPSKKSKQQTLF